MKSQTDESTLVAVYDILNCGPRSRFVANGKLVHNSGWGYNPQNLPRIYRDKQGAIIPSRTNVLRLCMKAPKGYRVVVSDLSGIEMRVNHFLWKVASSMKLFTDDPENADLYRNFAASLYNVIEAEVTKQQRQIGKVAHLGLGFSAGWATFIRIAKNMGGVDMEEDESRAVVQKWRLDYVDIVRGWKKCENALEYASNGQKVAIDPWEMCCTTRDGIMLPSGRKIDYPALRRGEHNGRAVWKFGEGRHLSFLSGGKVDENCIAEGSLVLTNNGWKPIETVELADLVHDGDEFVRHGGKLFKSIQPCVTVDGVYMTEDHEVLTNDGWKHAGESPQPYRPAVRRADRSALGGERRAPRSLAVPLRALAGIVREFLERHGGRVPAGLGFGPPEQRRGVLSGELPLGLAAREYHEQAGDALLGGYPRIIRANGERPVAALLPRAARMDVGGAVPRARLYKPVFDIKNAGPKHRFIVLGENGPFIVHNCVQALARDIIAENSAEITRQTGVYPSLLVHDERVDIVKENKADEHLATMNEIMRTPPKWWPELAVWSEGSHGESYGDSK